MIGQPGLAPGRKPPRPARNLKWVKLGALTVGLLPTSCLIQRSENYQQMSESAFAALKASMQDNGAASFILVAETKTAGVFEVLDGHHRWQAAEETGIAEVPAVLWNGKGAKDDVSRDLAMLQFNIRADVRADKYVERMHALALKLDTSELSLRTGVAADFIDSLRIQVPSLSLPGNDAQEGGGSSTHGEEDPKGPNRSRGISAIVALPNTPEVHALFAAAKAHLSLPTDADVVLHLLREYVRMKEAAALPTEDGDA